jgi:hypothetical protein
MARRPPDPDLRHRFRQQSLRRSCRGRLAAHSTSPAHTTHGATAPGRLVRARFPKEFLWICTSPIGDFGPPNSSLIPSQAVAVLVAAWKPPDCPVSIAINHNRRALGMHRINHPNTRHLCEDVWSVDPRSVCEGRPVGSFLALTRLHLPFPGSRRQAISRPSKDASHPWACVAGGALGKASCSARHHAGERSRFRRLGSAG